MSLIIAGERSGVGKTTVTLALLSFLCRWQKLSVQSFKVGPDYIDPMFHQYVTGSPCRNLDPVLTSETYVQQCFIHHTQQSEYALVEGVMGLFDGIGNIESQKLKVKSQNNIALYVRQYLNNPELFGPGGSVIFVVPMLSFFHFERL